MNRELLKLRKEDKEELPVVLQLIKWLEERRERKRRIDEIEARTTPS